MATVQAVPVLAQEVDPSTVAANREVAGTLPFADRADYERARRGFIATLDDPVIRTVDGRVLGDVTAGKDLKGDAPDTVNPSLWRFMQLSASTGLFKIADGVWQVRGLDMANMEVIAGKTGYILIDPLGTTEITEAAMKLVRKHLGDRPVTGMIYSHNHGDHFMGSAGALDPALAASGQVPVIAPKGFGDYSFAEQIVAGPAMGRRTNYTFGTNVPFGSKGRVIPPYILGTSKVVPPNHIVTQDGERMVIDGVTFEFQLTPDAEANAAMHIFMPASGTLMVADNATPSLHNLLTPRGAPVRDGKAWADDLTETLRRYGSSMQQIVSGHQWPHWGNAECNDFLTLQRDTYKFIHDQSVRMINEGLTPAEISNRLKLPPSLANRWGVRGNYGNVSFNARAVYQRYMGFYDGNPAHLDPMEPEAQAKHYVEALGGADRVLALAAKARSDGDLKWAVELLNNAVFADPADTAARDALAGVYDQMGWRAESYMWRNIYLSGAADLRGEKAANAVDFGSAGGNLGNPFANLSLSQILEVLSYRIDPAKAGDEKLTLALGLKDEDGLQLVTLANDVLVYQPLPEGAAVDGTVRITRSGLAQLLAGKHSAQDLIAAGEMSASGDAGALARLGGYLSMPSGRFNIVTP
ncbi:MAG: alkyl sulfatase dimerization domain-containing protein [Novosphingobium sp.]|nr:alkyl sulfatase dimerization domain-containing protein [Novosphingobium sp.]